MLTKPTSEASQASRVSEPASVHLKASEIGKLVAPGLLLALILLLPYFNKGYTIDDPLFLLEAKQILKAPLRPMSYPVCWMGNETCLAKAGNLGPGSTQALMGYLLVPVILSGGAEWMAHLIQFVLVCMSILAIVQISLRVGFDRLQSAAAGLLLVVIPPFLSMASTAMPDTASLAFGITGIERLLAWRDERRWHQALTAALALGLAPYARPHLVLLILLGGLWLFDEVQVRKAIQQFRREAYLWTPLLLAAAILLTVNLLTRDPGPKSEAKEWLFELNHIPRNLYSYLLYLSFPIPLAAVWLMVNWRKAPLLLVLPAVGGVLLNFTILRHRNMTLSAIAALYGLAALGFVFYRYLRDWDRLGLLLCLWLLVPTPIFVYFHFPIKYMVIALPPIVLILIRSLSTLPRPRQLSVYGAIVVLCGAYSCLLLRADADFADYSRRAATDLIAPHVAAGEKVWFGGQWGLYWYAEKMGARISKPGEPGPNPGELLAVGLMEGGGATRDRFPQRELVDSRHYAAPHGHTMGYGAGLYTNFYGYGPWLWVWNPAVTHDYELWRIH